MSDGTGAHGSITRPAGPVVVGVDGSPGAMRALAWAAGEARIRGAILDVVHVSTFRHEASETLAPGILADEMKVLERAVTRAKELESGVVVRGRVCDPPTARALIDASRGAEMLVVGSRGLSGVKELALGSVSRECAHRAQCPVVVIPPEVAVSPPSPLASGPARPEDPADG